MSKCHQYGLLQGRRARQAKATMDAHYTTAEIHLACLWTQHTRTKALQTTSRSKQVELFSVRNDLEWKRSLSKIVNLFHFTLSVFSGILLLSDASWGAVPFPTPRSLEVKHFFLLMRVHQHLVYFMLLSQSEHGDTCRHRFLFHLSKTKKTNIQKKQKNNVTWLGISAWFLIIRFILTGSGNTPTVCEMKETGTPN